MKTPILIAAGLLSACTLQSQAPHFAESQATLALGPAPVTLSGARGQMTLIPQGQHYAATRDGATKDIRFVALPAGGYVMQTVAGSRVSYAIATWDGETLGLRPLDCTRLKTDLRTNALVQLADNACRLRPGTDPLNAFAAMALAAPDATERLTRP